MSERYPDHHNQPAPANYPGDPDPDSYPEDPNPATADDFPPPPEDELLNVHDLLQLVGETYWLEDDDVPDSVSHESLAHLSVPQLWEIRKSITGIINAAKRVKKAIDDEMSEKLGPTGRARLDDFVVSSKGGTDLRIVDPEGFVEWLGEDWHNVFNLNSPRKTAIRAIAAQRDEDGGEIMQTYYEEVDKKPTISALPVDRAANKWKEKDHGYIEGVRRVDPETGEIQDA